MTSLSQLHPEVRARVEWLLAVAQRNGIPVQVTSTTRSSSRQAELRANFERCVARGAYPSSVSYGAGLSCKYPANQPGDSAHEYAVAWDSTVPPEWQATWTALREFAGFRVADENGDPIHAEVPGWRELRDAGVVIAAS